MMLTECFGICGHANRLHSHTERQGKEAVPSDCFPLADAGQPALPLAPPPGAWLDFHLPSAYRVGDGVLLGVRATPEPVPAT